MSQYSATFPGDGQIEKEIVKFFEDFYRISDTPDAHEKYAEFFTKDATLIMASNESRGYDQILAYRKSMWEKVVAREHYPKQIYTFGRQVNDVMLYGQVYWTLKGGGKAGIDWAARAHFTKANGELKMDFYQVYLDTTVLSRVE